MKANKFALLQLADINRIEVQNHDQEIWFESLYEYSCPQWFRDVKFGIWSHWGPQSVPMYGDWYARNMYIEDSPQYNKITLE